MKPPRTRSSPTRPRRAAPAARPRPRRALRKALTGIEGLDQITFGGLPYGRPTLVCGGAGCGKTLLAMQFLANGAERFDEPGVFVSFEETAEELAANFAPLGIDIAAMIAARKLAIDYVHIEPGELEETGEYNLEGLFVRIESAVRAVGAKRVVLDTPEALFGGFANEAILRAEIRRLFRWLKDHDLTAVVTAERGPQGLTRYGIEEYVSDCVVLLEHRAAEQVTTRRMRVVKYRGSIHGTDDYPFLIDERGISVLPVTSLGLDYAVSSERVSTGIEGLDAMLGAKGYYRGSSVLISGTAGTGKSSLAAYFADATCRRGEKCLYFAFEEPTQQILRNMRSIALDLAPWMGKGLLRIEAARPTLHGLELHLVTMHKLVETFQPSAVVVDPISSLVNIGNVREVKSMLTRLFDYLKTRGITGLFTYLSTPVSLDETEMGASSLIDTWLQVRDLEADGERNRGLYVLKSRGMAHSNQVREFRITDQGLALVDVYVGPGGVLTGSARVAQEAREAAGTVERRHEVERRQRALERRRREVEAHIAALRDELAAEQDEATALAREAEARESRTRTDETAMRDRRLGRTRAPDGAPLDRAPRSGRKHRA